VVGLRKRVIPSGAAQRRRRGIAIIPAEGLSIGTIAIPRLRSLLAAPLGMTRFASAAARLRSE